MSDAWFINFWLNPIENDLQTVENKAKRITITMDESYRDCKLGEEDDKIITILPILTINK